MSIHHYPGHGPVAAKSQISAFHGSGAQNLLASLLSFIFTRQLEENTSSFWVSKTEHNRTGLFCHPVEIMFHTDPRSSEGEALLSEPSWQLCSSQPSRDRGHFPIKSNQASHSHPVLGSRTPDTLFLEMVLCQWRQPVKTCPIAALLYCFLENALYAPQEACSFSVCSLWIIEGGGGGSEAYIFLKLQRLPHTLPDDK